MSCDFQIGGHTRKKGATRCWYFYRLREDDFVSEFCVIGSADPNQQVETMAPDGTIQQWEKRKEGNLIVFRPPDGYVGNQGLMWHYDRTLQHGEAAPRDVLEREALNNRLTIVGLG